MASIVLAIFFIIAGLYVIGRQNREYRSMSPMVRRLCLRLDEVEQWPRIALIGFAILVVTVLYCTLGIFAHREGLRRGRELIEYPAERAVTFDHAHQHMRGWYFLAFDSNRYVFLQPRSQRRPIVRDFKLMRYPALNLALHFTIRNPL